jgi:fructosamine-3-kinase
VPAVHACGTAAGEAFLALEWLDLVERTPLAERRLGAGLAAQHRCTADSFGYSRDNTIGPAAQINTRRRDRAGYVGPLQSTLARLGC